MTPQRNNVTDSAPTVKLSQHAFQNEENDGLEEVWPSLKSGNVEFGFDGEDPVEQSSRGRPVRLKAPHKVLDESEVRIEKAVHAKHRRNGHLRELRKRRNYAQDLISSPSVQVAEVESGITRYEEAFRNFVASHDNSVSFEADEEKKQLIIDSYDNEREREVKFGDTCESMEGGEEQSSDLPI